MQIPKLIAHRGYSARYPENTLASLEAALEAGATYVEFDVQMIADDDFILMHDADLQRSSGIKKSIFSLTSSTVRHFQADYYSVFQTQFSGIKIPLLAHAISLFNQFPEAVAIIEIKEECLAEFGVEHVMKHLLKQLSELKQACYIISFSYQAIDYVQQHSDYKTGYVLHKFNEEYYAQAEKLAPDLLVCNYRKLPELSSTGELPAHTLWPGKWHWALYLIDNAELALSYANNGIEFIETDHIGTLLQHQHLNSQVIKHNALTTT
ncbi:MAG: glycerophosphodiester phosphodiesterase family protein [Gammaproteobacteria bacterium]|nr:glycerophosphodiester phosphodiesterase family protein [Gammaproteobacteria bacterium]